MTKFHDIVVHSVHDGLVLGCLGWEERAMTREERAVMSALVDLSLRIAAITQSTLRQYQPSVRPEVAFLQQAVFQLAQADAVMRGDRTLANQNGHSEVSPVPAASAMAAGTS
jgi:hypothetical protein